MRNMSHNFRTIELTFKIFVLFLLSKNMYEEYGSHFVIRGKLISFKIHMYQLYSTIFVNIYQVFLSNYIMLLNITNNL